MPRAVFCPWGAAQSLTRPGRRRAATTLCDRAGGPAPDLQVVQQIGDSDGQPEDGGDWLIVMREVSDTAAIEAMSLSFKLTGKEAEVLQWVVKGKTNKDIGDILGSSPMTVKKHLERIFVKMGVETRTAAAGMAMTRIRQLHPQFEG